MVPIILLIVTRSWEIQESTRLTVCTLIYFHQQQNLIIYISYIFMTDNIHAVFIQCEITQQNAIWKGRHYHQHNIGRLFAGKQIFGSAEYVQKKFIAGSCIPFTSGIVSVRCITKSGSNTFRNFLWTKLTYGEI